MTDVLDEVFDPQVPLETLSRARVHGVNAAKARNRVLALLRERPLTGERVPLVPPDRVDRLAWREILAVIAHDDDLDDDLFDRPDDVLGAIEDYAEVLERLGFTARDLVRDIGAPDDLAGRLADMLEIAEEDPLVWALPDDWEM